MYPVIRPAIATIIGMAGMNFLLTRFHFSIYVTLAIFALLVGLTALAYFNKQLRNNNKIFGITALLAFLFLGALLFQWKFYDVEAKSHVGRRFRSGTAMMKPQEKEKWWTLRIKENDGGVVMAYFAKGSNCDPSDIIVGDSVFFLTYFNYPTSPYLRMLQNEEWKEIKRQKEEKKKQRRKNSKKHNNRDAITLNDTISNKSDSLDLIMEGYKRYLFYQGVSTVAFVSEGAWGYYYAEKEGRERFISSLPFWHDIAGKMKQRYALAGFSDSAEAIIEAMTTGDKSSISKGDKESFAKAGISHVLALSGFHLTVIVALLDVLLMRGLFKRRWKKITALMIIPFIWAFAFIAGLPPSLVRATTMCTFLQLALVIGNTQGLKNACGIAVFIMLIANPLNIMDVGFQLSFLSIIGIATIGVPLCKMCGRKLGRWAYITDIICISITCTLFTFPAVAYYFGQIPVYAIFSNLFVSIIATMFMWAALFWWIFIWWTTLNSLMTNILDFLANAMLFVADKVAQLPLSTIKYSPSLIDVIIIYITIALAILYAKKKSILPDSC